MRQHTNPIACAAVLVAVLSCGCVTGPPAGRVIVLGIDGMDPNVVDLLLSEGKLPNFARLRQDGAYGRFLSAKPILSPVIWTTIATGKTPDHHGIGHFVAMQGDSGQSLPVTSRLRRVKAVWNILSEANRKVGVVGWWATWPAEAVQGVVVSDHLCYHFLFPEGQAGTTEDAGLTHPPALREQLAPLVRRPRDITLEEASRYIQVAPEEFDRAFSFENDISHFRWALATADTYKKVGLKLWGEQSPDVLLTYTEAVDSTSHLFGHLFRAEGLAGELAEQQARFGGAVEQMYLYADRLVGEFLEVMDANTTLIVCSDHGFSLGRPQDDPSKTRDMRRVSERFHTLEGILYLYGHNVRRHARLQQPKLVDITPTILALAGLPAARDMPGRVLTEGLKLAAPERTVASYETGDLPPSVAQNEAVDPLVLERLRSLGYLDAAPEGAPGAGTARSRDGERNIAAVMFENGRLEESLEIYSRLSEEDPDDASLLASASGVLGALGRYDEALRNLDRAIALEPLNVEAYHNRGVIFERQGRDRDQIIAQYRTAVRYSPQYEPSRRALTRLTGSASVNAPTTPEQQRALALAEEAGRAARRGDYALAATRLDEAERLAPRYVIVHQYRSNVAYLKGDFPAAVSALERALEIEPDNALFRTNLQRLQEQLGRE